MVMGCIAACRYTYSTRQVPAPSSSAWTDGPIATTVDTLHHMHHTHPAPYRSGCAAPLPAGNEGLNWMSLAGILAASCCQYTRQLLRHVVCVCMYHGLLNCMLQGSTAHCVCHLRRSCKVQVSEQEHTDLLSLQYDELGSSAYNGSFPRRRFGAMTIYDQLDLRLGACHQGVGALSSETLLIPTVYLTQSFLSCRLEHKLLKLVNLIQKGAYSRTVSQPVNAL